MTELKKPRYLAPGCSASAMLADPSKKWGVPFAPYEIVWQVTSADGTEEYLPASTYYIVGGPDPAVNG
jgi:hypothetical protein